MGTGWGRMRERLALSESVVGRGVGESCECIGMG